MMKKDISANFFMCFTIQAKTFCYHDNILGSRPSNIKGFSGHLWRSILIFANKALYGGRRGGLMVSAFDSGASGPGSSPGWGHGVVFLGRTLYSHSTSLHPGV